MHAIKRLLHDSFHAPETRAFVLANDVLAALTLLSILGIVLETVQQLSWLSWLWVAIEYSTVFFFSLEYIGRVLSAPAARSYVFSFFGIIDLLAVLPTLLGLGNLTYLKTARTLRILRFLRMIRLAKIARFNKAHTSDIEQNVAIHRLNLQIYFVALITIIVIFGSLIYIFEGQQTNFTNIPLGMLWATKVILGDVPHAEPTSALGQVVLITTRFAGLFLFGLLLSVMNATLQRLLLGSSQK